MKGTANALEFSPGARFPVVGEQHPLRLRYQKILYRATAIAAGIHILFFGGWLAYRLFKPEPDRPREVKIVSYLEMGVPPSIAEEATPQVNVAQQVVPPSIGIPEPVPDFQAETQTIATTEEMSEALVPTDLSSLGGSGDSLVVELPEGDPSPDDFVAYEDPPVLINLPSPVYPDMARQAEVEGLVMVRVLVGKDGKVEDAFVTEGQPMLNDAAIAAAKKATFKPALQQHKPVAVWVQIPLRFSLH